MNVSVGPDTGGAARSRYPLDNAAPQAGARFVSLEKIYDHVTRRHLDRLGIGAGWHCLEIGAGGGSIARFLADRVAAAGTVVATDLNTDWITGPMPANLELRRHDVGTDPLPQHRFDLVHARAVLTFVPEPEAVLARMVAALRPGGWLLVEEMGPPLQVFDHPDDPGVEFVRAWRAAFVEWMRRHGADPSLSCRLPAVLRAAGLDDVGAEGYFLPIRTAAVVGLARANVDQIGAALVGAGLVTAAELDGYAAVLARAEPSLPVAPPLISVWGRRGAPLLTRRGYGSGGRDESGGRDDG